MRCWPEWSARYRARWQEEDRLGGDAFLRGDRTASRSGSGMTFEAATWHSTLEFVREIEASMSPSAMPPSPRDLETVVAQIVALAPELEGEMPFAVEAFIARYGAKHT